MFNPVSTYRIQFHAGFTFKDFDRILPYLHQMGISTIYASPVFKAIPGSMHGYDVVHPNRINPEIGTLEELRSLSGRMKEMQMSWIQDIVPNHMAFHPDNSWLMDVLEKGEASAYAGFFDINWSGEPELPLMVPFLGSSTEEAVAAGDLKLALQNGRLKLQYFDTYWPLNDRVTGTDMPVEQAIELQYYRPCHWEETNRKINYRRFFTVNSLICLNMQADETFREYHRLITELLEEGVFQGLRVDHIDGLYRPEEYFSKLRALAGDQTYIVVEKILEQGERLPEDWPVQGTTGYDFLSQVNNLFTNRRSETVFTNVYQQFTADDRSVAQQIAEKKSLILSQAMAGELENLYHYFLQLELVKAKELKQLPSGSLKEAIGQLLVDCPVYRFYGESLPLPSRPLKQLKKLFKQLAENDSLKAAAGLLKKIFIDRPEKGDREYNRRAAAFYLRCMQFSGPLMAKGVEDTLMYTYHRFTGHNEVGDAPDAFGISRKVFHNEMWKRQKSWPLAMNGTSTHDTKRGEDVRARLNVLSDLPEEWAALTTRWQSLHRKSDHSLNANDQYFIYQTIAGSYPMPGMPEADYPERLRAYLEKALREGKLRSSWASPDESYEHLVREFASGLLEKDTEFWKSFSVFHKRIADFGILNSLSQVLLKFTCPGMPDVYQGTECWDLSLVDPDNRRPVDYRQHAEMLAGLQEKRYTAAELWQDRYSGKLKLWLLHTLLQFRKSAAGLFTAGAYLPLKVKGKYAGQVFAFARKYRGQWLVTAVPLGAAAIKPAAGEFITEMDWEDTRIILPDHAPLQWSDILTGEKGELEQPGLLLSAVFQQFPLALIRLNRPENKRGAGILMHLTSLPSAYGIGDLGPEAQQFVSFLAASGQRYWQLLPLNPVTGTQSFSPYSSFSAMAGNILLISPEDLRKDGLLKRKQLKKAELPLSDKVDYEKVSAAKQEMLHQAYQQFKAAGNFQMTEAFRLFCKQESAWLEDFALFTVLKEAHGQAPWYEWEEAYQQRDSKALLDFAAEHREELEAACWYQFIFYRQWNALKDFAAAQGVKFYGDLPFYIGHDAADVWAHPGLFSLDAAGRVSGMAGVPPDYFNAEGQLWGMPVFRWDQLKQQHYSWWIDRIRKNLELYDLLRLDHFRAFSGYWEVQAGEHTAQNGKWMEGPGEDFFLALERAFPDLPFVAEDLGEITAEVYRLRDRFNLPGMKVLQFAFGRNMPDNEHIPHRYAHDHFVVYTGTHDNNTTTGWFLQEAGNTERKNIRAYTGQTPRADRIAEVMIRLAYGSVARLAILPMQDVLGLDGGARMNRPASVNGNWEWRMKKQPSGRQQKFLYRLAYTFGRIQH